MQSARGVFQRKGWLWLAHMLLGSVFWVQANPEGGAVVAGQAQITSAGNTLHIHQASDRAVINWRDFSIQPGETTQFHQPSSSSAVLNRVTSTSPSHLLGQLQANGQVYLMNPNGIFFGPGAVINASSFLAATADLAPSDFMAGRLGSLVASDAGTLRNEGRIRAEDGSVQLFSRTVENSGTLEAPKGEVGLYAGRKFYLETDRGGPIRVQVDLDAGGAGKAGTGIDQRGVIRAAQAKLEANGNIYALAIQQGGLVEATGFTARPDGVVVLSAPGGTIRQAGTVVARDDGDRGGEIVLRAKRVESDLASIQTASGSAGGGEIRVEAGDTAYLQGRLEVSSSAGRAGRLVVTGRQVGFLKGTIDASGAMGGGEVLFGGDYLGANPSIRNAEATVVGLEARILADAQGQGDGGKIILWSEQYTGFYGQLFARGGPEGGDGGFIETSSRDNLQAFGWADASAAAGSPGLWLLDPRNVLIQTGGAGSLSGGVFTPATDNATIAPATITAALNAGTSVEINTGSTGAQAGNITVVNEIVTAGGALNATLTLSAANDVLVNAAVNLSTMAGAGNVRLLADADASGAGTVTTTAVVTAGGTGTVTLQGAGRINVGATVTAQNVIFQPSTVAASMGVVDLTGTVQVLLSDLQNVSATGIVTVGRANSSGTIRIGGTANVDLSAEGYGLAVLTGSSGQARLNGNITTAGRPITFDTAVVITGNRTLKTDQGVASGEAITLNGAVDSDGLSGPTGLFWDLNLVAGSLGNVTMAQAVGVGARLGDITVGPANQLTIQGAVRAESLSTTGALNGNILLNGSLNFSNHGITAADVKLNLSTLETITLNAGADVTSGGPITLEGLNGITTAADFFATDASITFKSPVVLSGPTAVTIQGATAGGGLPPEIRFESTVDDLSGNGGPPFDLTLNAGSFGDVVFVGGAGQLEALGIVQVVSANNLTVAAMRSSSFLQTTGYGQTTFNGPQQYSGGAGLAVTTLGNIAVAAASITTSGGGTVTLVAGQKIDIGSGGDIQSDGVVSLTAAGGITTGGDILTSGDNVQVQSAVLLASDVTVDTTTSGSTLGKVIFSSTVDGPYALTVKSSMTLFDLFGDANVQFLKNVGGINSLADLDVSGFRISLQGSNYTVDQTSGGSRTSTFQGSVILGTDVSFDLNGVLLDNNLSFLGTVNSDSTARSLTINTGTGVLRFDGAAGFQILGPALNNVVIFSGPLASTGVVQMKGASFLFGSALGVRVTDSSVGLLVNSSGLVSFPTAIGEAGTPLASLSIQGSSMVFGGSNIRTVENVSISTGIVTTPDLEGPGGALNVTATTGDITITGLIDTRGKTGASQQNGGAVSITTAGAISVADVNTSAGTDKDAGTITLNSGDDKTITLNGTITATGGANGSSLSFNDDVILGGAVSILTAGSTGTSGDITFDETLGGSGSLTINSGQGDVVFKGATGTPGAPTGVITIEAAGFLTVNGAISASSLELVADQMTLGATLSSVSGPITLRPFTAGRGMSISDPSATGLVLSLAEVGQIRTTGLVTFGGEATGTIELAGTPNTAFGYDTRFLSGGGIRVNGNIGSAGFDMEWATPATIVNSLSVTAASLSMGGNLAGAGRTLTLFTPQVLLTGSEGTERTIAPNLSFGANTTLGAPGLITAFTGSLHGIGGTPQLVLTAGSTGSLSFTAPVGAGAESFANLLVQGGGVLIGPGALLRAGTVTVDAGSFYNLAGSGALAATTGRVLLFSANPNGNAPTSFNGGVTGLNPLFNQPARIQLGSAPGTYTVGGSLPGGSLAIFAAQLADVLSAQEVFQFSDQQAFLGAVPVTSFQLPSLDLAPLVIRRSSEAFTASVRLREFTPSGLGQDLGQNQPRAREKQPTKRVETPFRAGLSPRLPGSTAWAAASYSQYSQGLDSLSQ